MHSRLLACNGEERGRVLRGAQERAPPIKSGAGSQDDGKLSHALRTTENLLMLSGRRKTFSCSQEAGVIEMRRAQLSFGDELIAEEVSDLREDWMQYAEDRCYEFMPPWLRRLGSNFCQDAAAQK
jgi:hypothetical protein